MPVGARLLGHGSRRRDRMRTTPGSADRDTGLDPRDCRTGHRAMDLRPAAGGDSVFEPPGSGGAGAGLQRIAGGASGLPSHWTESLRLADRHIRRAQALDTLQASVGALERSNKLQRALFAISDLAGSERDMPEMLRGIHAIVGTLMYAENFFIVLHDAERDTIRFLYFADVEDPAPRDPTARSRWTHARAHPDLVPDPRRQAADGQHRGAAQAGVRAAGRCRPGQPRLARRADAARGPGARRAGGAELPRRASRYHRRGPGAAGVRRQPHPDRAGTQAGQGRAGAVACTCARCELADANRGLQLEIVERQRAERLQAALFQIAAAGDRRHQPGASSTAACTRWSASCSTRENFFIALLTEDARRAGIPVLVDAAREHRRPRGRWAAA